MNLRKYNVRGLRKILTLSKSYSSSLYSSLLLSYSRSLVESSLRINKTRSYLEAVLICHTEILKATRDATGCIISITHIVTIKAAESFEEEEERVIEGEREKRKSKNRSHVIELQGNVIVKLFTVENKWRSLFESRKKRAKGTRMKMMGAECALFMCS